MQLFHVSESPDIQAFISRPSPSFYEAIHQNVVFAIEERLLHNYLLPRDCPRVTYYCNKNTTLEDKERFLGFTDAHYSIVIESKWLKAIESTTLYCYQFPSETFFLLDEVAGYYVSYEPIIPRPIQVITNPLHELLSRTIDVQFTPNLWKIADAVAQSSLSFSFIRMRHAQSRPFSSDQPMAT